MCKVIEEMRKGEREEGMEEGIKEGMAMAALRMLDAGKYALEEIAAISGLSLNEVTKIQNDKSA